MPCKANVVTCVRLHRADKIFLIWDKPRPRPSSSQEASARQDGIRWTTRPGLRPASTPRINGSREVGPRGVGAGHPAIPYEGGGSHPYPRPAYAALDLGTNNCRLLVARPIREGFRVIDAFSRIIRLGEGMAASGRLGEAAIGRALEALSICRDKMRNRGVTRARLIATEACRSAENGVEFRARVQREVGLDLEIVDRETEAKLAAIGCTPLMDPACESVILFDIGGGSSEIVRLGRNHPANGGPPSPQIRGWASLPRRRRVAGGALWRREGRSRALRGDGRARSSSTCAASPPSIAPGSISRRPICSAPPAP